MAVILGSLTTVSVGGISDGIQSISWQLQVSTNHLWQLGDWDAYGTQVTKTESISLTTYAGVLPAIPLVPSTSCDDSTAVLNIGVTVAECGGFPGASLEVGNRFINSYSYSKGDPNAFGQESWSLQNWLDAGVSAPLINTVAPTYVIQGKSEGNYTGDLTNLPADAGLIMEAAGQVTGTQGNVSAGFPGIGSADTTTFGFITSIGGGVLEDAGKIGQSSATIPHSPLYLGSA